MKVKASKKWTGDERRAEVLRLVERAKLAVGEGDKAKTLDCLLCIRMVCERTAANLELNRAEIEKAYDRI